MKSPKRFCLCTWHWGQQGRNDGSKGTWDWTDCFSLAVTLVKLCNSSLSMFLHLWSGMVRVLTSPGHWIIAFQAHYCALTCIISFNLFETGMIIRGWLRGVKTLVQGHTAKNKFEPRSLSLQCASKSCACNNYTNFVSVPWTLKSRERETLMAGHDTGLSLRGQCRLHFTEGQRAAVSEIYFPISRNICILFISDALGTADYSTFKAG